MDAIKEQGVNILVGAVSNVGAKHIGINYKTSAQTGTDKAIQLTSHAALGAGISYLSGNDALSGAVSGVVGEVVGEASIKHLNQNKADKQGGIITLAQIHQNKNIAKELSGVAGAYSSIFTGNLVGNSDSEIADNMFSGQRIGKNAAENNALANVSTAIVGGVAGAGGAAWGAYVGGADVKGILISAGTGGVIGAGSGFMMNPNGVLIAMGQSSGLGAFTGAASSYAFTRYNNPDASNREIANNVIEGTIGGALTGLTTAAFTPIGSGVPGAILGAQNGLAVDLFVGAFSAKYDILNTTQTKNNKPQNNNESK